MDDDFINRVEKLKSLQETYFEAWKKIEPNRKTPEIKIEFYAYVGLRHTIRIRDGILIVRISDLMINAQTQYHQALAEILIAKLLKKRVSKTANEVYERFARQAETIEKSNEIRKARSYKITTSPRGKFYDLDEIFDYLNRNYFENALPQLTLSWSKTKTFRLFGHHDALHETIIISKTLDDGKIPKFVTEFVLYHELLHVKHPTQIVNGRRQIHTAIFRRDEMKFAKFDEAENWINRIARSRKTKR
ncbi:MAG: M48 family peptidase [Pyrinomonadaceae bacterium]|nr:M48 family peptidase [Pyrinomonadaceae bacterium]